jgi:hypothetical protein
MEIFSVGASNDEASMKLDEGQQYFEYSTMAFALEQAERLGDHECVHPPCPLRVIQSGGLWRLAKRIKIPWTMLRYPDKPDK